MEKWLSNKFKWMSFVATWAVVCIHSRTDRWSSGVYDWASHMQESIADFFYFAVPLFFVISGFMFEHSYRKYRWTGLIRNKCYSLYLPLVLWSFLGVALCLPIRIYSNTDMPTFLDVALIPLMVLRAGYLHFWYVRALIVLTLLAPCVLFCSRRLYVAMVLLTGVWLIPGNSVFAKFHIPVVVFFFLFGCLLSRPQSIVLLKKNGTKFSLIMTVVLCILLAIVTALKDVITVYFYVSLVQPVLMIAILWFLYDAIDSVKPIPLVPECFQVTYFVYCVHIIVLCWVGGVWRSCFGVGPVSRSGGYIFLCMTFWFNIVIANLLKKVVPRIYNVLAGNR